MRLLALTTALLALLAVAPSAHAEEPRQWYGWQTLAADASAMSAGVLLTNVDYKVGKFGGLVGPSFVFGYGGWLLATPIVHAAHGKYLEGVGSLGLRAALPVVGVLVGCAMDTKGDYPGFDCFQGAALGALAGGGIAMALDAGVFSYQKPSRARSR